VPDIDKAQHMKHARHQRKRKRTSTVTRLGVPLLVAILVVAPSWIGLISLLMLLGKMIVSHRSARAYDKPDLFTSAPRPYVTVIVPMYNEDPEIIRRTVRSLLAQTRPPDFIHVIDDGSHTWDAVSVASEELVGEHGARIGLQQTNCGKREAIAMAVRADSKADIFVTVDSDTVLDDRALAKLLVAFDDPRVTGATGLVRVLNKRRNLLTRLVDLRYANAFLMDRGFQSAFGSVLCACGSLAAWRRSVIEDNVDDFTNQRFLGSTCTYGDDRRLTNYALKTGRVALVPEAIAYTAAPERIGHYLRQQLRWNKSFVRESLWAVAHLPASRPAMWMSLVEFTTWTVFTLTMLWALVRAPVMGASTGVVTYMFYAALMAWARSLRWFDARTPEDETPERWGTFFIAPLYAFVHVLLLLPLRIVAVATLRQNSWGTRNTVEVALQRSVTKTHRDPADVRLPSPLPLPLPLSLSPPPDPVPVVPDRVPALWRRIDLRREDDLVHSPA
jgi:hyaluronan synthase